jgi:hypothetical protein
MKSQRLHLPALLGLALATAASALAQSAVPNLMSYQSRVADAAGVPLGATTPVNRIVHFRIYDSPNLSAAANRLFSEQQTVTIAAGEFSVLIGSGTPIASESGNAFSTLSPAVFGGAARYLGVTIDDGDGNPLNDPELSPRQQIIGTPFAFRAAVAESVAVGGVSSVSLANNAVTATQLADSAVTPTKLADNAVDGSKILDGSINLTDLSPSLQTIMPKPTVTYNQGLGAFTTVNNSQYLIFPIDLNSLATDSRVVIYYEGSRKSGISATGFFSNFPAAYVNASPQTISGSVRISVPTFLGGSGAAAVTNVTNSAAFGSTGAATSAPTTNIPFVAVHTGMGPKSNFAVAGVLGYAAASPNNTGFPTIVAGSEPADPDTPGGVSTYIIQNNSSAFYDFGPGAYFPRGAATWSYSTWIDPLTFPSVVRIKTASISVGNVNSSFFSAPPVAAAVAYARSTTDNSANNQGGNFTVHRAGGGFGMFYIFNYYPGSISGVPPAGLNVGADVNNGANIPNFSGPAMTHNVASVQAGTNKLTITLANPHVIQIGDTVVISGMTGTPAVNASYTVAALPSNNSFEIPAPGVVGPYTGGTITHTPTYNKYRFWVAVHNTYNARVIVSDK